MARARTILRCRLARRGISTDAGTLTVALARPPLILFPDNAEQWYPVTLREPVTVWLPVVSHGIAAYVLGRLRLRFQRPEKVLGRASELPARPQPEASAT